MIQEFITQNIMLIVGAITFVLGFLGYGSAKVKQGKSEARQEAQKKVIDNIAKANEANEDAKKLNEAEVDDSLRDNGWMRDD